MKQKYKKSNLTFSANEMRKSTKDYFIYTDLFLDIIQKKIIV